MTLYKALGNAAGSMEARELAGRLATWHDAMVKHLRYVTVTGAVCADGCPHEEARALWREARALFGDATAKLVFLRTYGASAAGRATRRLAASA